MGRVLMIYADAGGRPISHPVVCHERARRRLVRDARLDSRCSTIARVRVEFSARSIRFCV